MLHFLQNFWDYVVVFLIVLTVVVFVHEMGHYLVARVNKVRIETFSIGFGPELFGWTAKNGTRWKVSALPLGGYVKMFGDLDAASRPDTDASFTEEERLVAFPFKRVGQRSAIVVAGPLANFVFGILVLALLFMIYGQPSLSPVVGEVQPDSPAARAGVEAGDRILAADGHAVGRFQDLQRIIRLTVGDPVTLTVQRSGTKQEIVVLPALKEVPDAFGNLHKMPVLGVVADPNSAEIIHHGPLSAIVESFRQTGEMVSDTFTGLGQMLSGRRPTDELAGPLRIAKGAGQAAKLGVGSVVYYIVLLSINLGLINLFPVPMLDGGHLLFYGIEAVLGRPLSPRAQEYGFRFGLILVFGLMLLATRNDLADLRIWEMIKGLMS